MSNETLNETLKEKSSAIVEPGRYTNRLIVNGDKLKTDPFFRGEINQFEHDLANDRPLFEALGCAIEQNGREKFIEVPNMETLNTTLRELHGKTVRRFVVSDGEAPVDDYLTMISNGEIPISRDPFYMLHDVHAHAPGFMLVPERTFSFMMQRAKKSLDTESEDSKTLSVRNIDSWSGVFTEVKRISPRAFSTFYEGFMSKRSAAILAVIDFKRYKHTARQLRKSSGDRFSLPAMADIVPVDEDLPIK